MAIAIWKDTYYTASSAASPLSYTIKVNAGEYSEGGTQTTDWAEIFNGKAWCAPSSSTLEININNIAQDYLSTDLPDLRTITASTVYTHANACKEFRVYSGSSLLTACTFVNDWSYNDLNYSTNQNLSNPINDRKATNMLTFDTNWDATNNLLKTTITPVSAANCCDRYAIYYLNRNGGWDYLAVDLVQQTDTYDRYYVERAYKNTSIDFGKKPYNNQITSSWEITTPWFNDKESEKFATHVLASNSVYLHDLKSGVITPVIVTDAEIAYKEHKRERSVMSYTFNVEASQKRQNLG